MMLRMAIWGVCPTPLVAPDHVQLKWSAVFNVDADVLLLFLRRVQWEKRLGSFLATPFARYCADGGEH